MPRAEMISYQDKKIKAYTSKPKKNGDNHSECPQTESNLMEEQTAPAKQGACIATINVQSWS